MAPALIAGGTALYGWYQNRKQANAQEGMQQGQMDRQNSLANYLRKQSEETYNLSAPAYGKAISWYQSLLGGNRTAMNQAVAPAVGQLNETYKGAERGLDRMGIRGGERDMARAELQRQKAGQIGGLTVGVQPAAADKLGQLGMQGMYASLNGSQASGSAGMNAANIYDSLLRRSDVQFGRDAETGQSLMSLIMPWLNQLMAQRRGQNAPVSGLPGATSPGGRF